MTQDPVLFTSFEWVLMAMAGLVCLLLFALVQRDEADLPFAERDERRSRDEHAPIKLSPEREGKASHH
ncbi:hypothetical protein [Roseibium aggregatum]|uniref:Uncharacterized protein n=1 Tax=Roseibium aggregatum TaxID=187304 RepID=A0A939J124_9HYPH|nr:hypothetical protein [Roseibium aggregatum]MBN9669898.1 hypothetical protein [Roseibium aggregatum]